MARIEIQPGVDILRPAFRRTGFDNQHRRRAGEGVPILIRPAGAREGEAERKEAERKDWSGHGVQGLGSGR